MIKTKYQEGFLDGIIVGGIIGGVVYLLVMSF